VGVLVSGTLASLQKNTEEKQIPLYEENLPKIQQGWQGKQKGLLQMLWERGWIDEGNISQYTVDSRKDVFGVFQPHTSLKYLMGNCKDFEEEELLLQLMGRKSLKVAVRECLSKSVLTRQ
jgi:hypothetical protein